MKSLSLKLHALCTRRLLGTVFVAVSTCISASESACAIEMPVVTIDFKYPPVLLMSEVPPFTITLSNSTSSAIPIIGDAERASARQVFVEVKYGDTNLTAQLRRLGNPDRIKYVEADGDWASVLSLSDMTLPSGGTKTWRGRDLSGDAYGVSDSSAQAIRAHVVFCSNAWASTQWVQFQEIDKYAHDLPVIVTNILLCGPQQNPMESFLHKGVIDGRAFVFTEGGSRLCEIPPGVVPEFTWNPTSYVGQISFPGSTNTPVTYDGRRGEIISE